MRKVIKLESHPIKAVVCKFYNEVCKDKHHRFISWEHCYRHFKSNKIDIDLAALHLAFYLASWGMYRGSSGILWKDYKIHKEAVRIIIKPEYKVLKQVNAFTGSDEYKVKLISLFQELSEYYGKCTYSNGKTLKKIKATDTLITKIILGTMGAFPALDRYFCDGFNGMYNKVVTRCTPKTIETISSFLTDNRIQIKMTQDEVYNMNGNSIKYPPMKIVDMYFWQIGAINL